MATICGMLRLLTDDGAPFSNTAQSTFNEPSRASGSVASDLVDAAVVEDELGTDSVGDGATVEEELAEPAPNMRCSIILSSAPSSSILIEVSTVHSLGIS